MRLLLLAILLFSGCATTRATIDIDARPADIQATSVKVSIVL